MTVSSTNSRNKKNMVLHSCKGHLKHPLRLVFTDLFAIIYLQLKMLKLYEKHRSP
ncbi:MAG: hypothetical protein BWY26_00036 [Elusimicrobia bacterium ADurb.Bin231]|nr:MAG: hypothetical protein BWY26_00036 [Elusimicrobia bacterium ADurb.Bin231]